MSRTRRRSPSTRAALCVVATIAAARPAHSAVQALGIEAEHIDAIVRDAMVAGGVPSYAVGVVVGDHLAYARAFGVVDRETGEAATIASLYQVGSITKVFTATLLAILRDDGAVRLDDPVTSYLPEGVPLVTLPSGAGAVTLRHLATHTSGLARDPIGVNRKAPMSAAALLGALPRNQPVLPTGRQFWYSNLGFQLLGVALERASGESYPDLLRARLLEPLGMESTRIAARTEDALGLAAHYWVEDGGSVAHPPWLFGEACGAGGIVSNVPDLARFLSFQLRAYVDAAGPVRAATLREMHTPARLRDSSWEHAIGLGWWIVAGGHGDVVHHGGETDGHAATIGFCPEHAIGVVVLANLGGDSTEPLARDVVRYVRELALAEREYARMLHEAGDWEESELASRVLLERNPGDAWAHSMLGHALLRTEDFDGAERAFERAAELGYAVGTSHYNAACASARAGNADRAFELLHLARRTGFADREQARTDPDLAGLRADPRWIETFGQR